MERRPVLLEISTNIWSEEVTGMPVVYSTHKEFVGRGFEVHFVIPKDEKLHEEQHGIRIWRFWIPFFEHYPEKYGGGVWWIISRIQWFLFFLLGTIKMIRLAKRLQPDVLYGHGPYAIPVASLVGKLRNIPTISRTYGFVFAREYSRLQHLMNFDLPLSLWVPADAYVIGDDGTYVRELAERFGVDMDKANFWIDGHDKEMFREDLPEGNLRESLGISPRDKIIVTVSSLTEYKGIHHVVTALSKVLEKIEGVTYLILGKGPERENLEALAAQLGIQDRIIFVGAVPHNEVGKYLSIADVVPCLWSIGPIFEAMLCGKPVIVLDILQMRRFVKDRETGILLDPNRMDLLADAMIELLDNDSLRSEIGKNARKWADENLDSVEGRAKKEADLVERVAGFRQ
jgi:glycosyltransferase involved in cell wall biosynthesis